MTASYMRRIILAAAITIALVCVLAAALTSADNAPAVPASDDTGHLYILSGFGGYVAVYDAGAQTPRFITDTRIDSLPRTDREMLQEGIKVFSDTELAALLEDYGT